MLKKIFIIRGEEASGKTTFVRELEARGLIPTENLIIKDEVARDLGYTPAVKYTKEVRDNLYKTFFEEIAKTASEKKIILVEAPFSDQGKVDELLSVLQKQLSPETEINILTFIADYEVRSERARSRKELVGFSRGNIENNRVAFYPELNFPEQNLNIKTEIIDVSKISPENIISQSKFF